MVEWSHRCRSWDADCPVSRFHLWSPSISKVFLVVFCLWKNSFVSWVDRKSRRGAEGWSKRCRMIRSRKIDLTMTTCCWSLGKWDCAKWCPISVKPEIICWKVSFEKNCDDEYKHYHLVEIFLKDKTAQFGLGLTSIEFQADLVDGIHSSWPSGNIDKKFMRGWQFTSEIKWEISEIEREISERQMQIPKLNEKFPKYFSNFPKYGGKPYKMLKKIFFVKIIVFGDCWCVWCVCCWSVSVPRS